MSADGTWTRAGAYEPSHFEQWKSTKEKKIPVMIILGKPCLYNLLAAQNNYH